MDPKLSLNIQLTELARISTVGGDVLRGLSCSEQSYLGFGEAYFSWVNSGTIKAWKRHKKMTMNIVVPVGLVRFVFCYIQGRKVLQKKEAVIGQENYARLTVPPGIWFGFMGVSQTSSLILNIADIPHDPNEVEHIAFDKLNYRWEK